MRAKVHLCKGQEIGLVTSFQPVKATDELIVFPGVATLEKGSRVIGLSCPLNGGKKSA